MDPPSISLFDTNLSHFIHFGMNNEYIDITKTLYTHIDLFICVYK